MTMMKKTAIVTGGSRGIGLAIAKQLGVDGFQITIFSNESQEQCQKNLEQLNDLDIDYLYIQGDLTNPQDRERLVKDTVSHFGDIHVLVNNAGVAPRVRAGLLEMSEESFDWVVGINLKGTLFLTQLVAKQMLIQEIVGKKRGSIINITSCSASVSSINRGEYCISKAGLSMVTTLFADRLAEDRIFVNEIRPGVIATDMTSGVQEKYDRLIEQGVFPIARWGTPEDIADAVSVFAGERFLYTTGSVLDVDGGFHIQRL